jgi:hypothetical protein
VDPKKDLLHLKRIWRKKPKFCFVDSYGGRFKALAGCQEDMNLTRVNRRNGLKKLTINNSSFVSQGLTPKRNKLQRNPRVKNRVKFEKAKKRRKGAVREVRIKSISVIICTIKKNCLGG